MKPKTLVFEPWHKAKDIKGWQKLYKGRDMPNPPGMSECRKKLDVIYKSK